MSLLETAIRIALDAHAGQEDKAGRPYILHPLTLMLQMDTEEEMIVAVLHDVVEDSNVTLDELATAGFPPDVLAALALLTHDTAAVSYDDYIAALLAADTPAHRLARKVKRADLAHNMDVRRLPEITLADLGRLSKYRRAWAALSE